MLPVVAPVLLLCTGVGMLLVARGLRSGLAAMLSELTQVPRPTRIDGVVRCASTAPRLPAAR